MESMKLKNAEIVNAYNAINDYASKASGKFGWALTRNLRFFQPVVEDLEATLAGLREKHPETEGEGRGAEFSKEVQDLLDTPTEVQVYSVGASQLPDDLPSMVSYHLFFLIEDEK